MKKKPNYFVFVGIFCRFCLVLSVLFFFSIFFLCRLFKEIIINICPIQIVSGPLSFQHSAVLSLTGQVVRLYTTRQDLVQLKIVIQVDNKNAQPNILVMMKHLLSLQKEQKISK